MPVIRNYEVRQERRVVVSAESPADAVRIGQAAFDGEDHTLSEIGGYVVREVRVTGIDASEEI